MGMYVSVGDCTRGSNCIPWHGALNIWRIWNKKKLFKVITEYEKGFCLNNELGLMKILMINYNSFT